MPVLNPTPQPAKAVIILRRRLIKDLAAEIGVSEHFLGRVLNGWAPPSDRVRSGLSQALGLPEEVLFRREWREVA